MAGITSHGRGLRASRNVAIGTRTAPVPPHRLRALPMQRCSSAVSPTRAATVSVSGGAARPTPRRAPLGPAASPQPRRATLAAATQPSSAAAGVGIFPAGQKQARVDLPALMVEVDAAAFSAAPQSLLNDVNAAVTAGATAVVLGAGAAGAAGLYEAAVQLKALLRGRAALLLLDRTDIATAVEAEGVVLSAAGACCAVLRCAVLAVLCCAVLCCAVLCCAVLCCAVLLLKFFLQKRVAAKQRILSAPSCSSSPHTHPSQSPRHPCPQPPHPCKRIKHTCTHTCTQTCSMCVCMFANANTSHMQTHHTCKHITHAHMQTHHTHAHTNANPQACQWWWPARCCQAARR